MVFRSSSPSKRSCKPILTNAFVRKKQRSLVLHKIARTATLQIYVSGKGDNLLSAWKKANKKKTSK